MIMRDRTFQMTSSLFKGKGRQFILGLCLGLSVSLLLQTHRHLTLKQAMVKSPAIRLEMSENSNQIIHGEINSYKDEDDGEGGGDVMHGWMDKHAGGDGRVHEFEDEHVHHDDDSIAQDLYKRVRVLCWILTSPTNLKKKTIHVKKTWARRCNVQLFMSSEKDDSFPTIGLNVSEGREHLTAKTMQAFQYIYQHHYHDAEWFMKADDDTYVILENLRYFLSDEDPQDPVYFGHRFKPFLKQGYSSGGGGYVLSKEALRRYGQIGSLDPKLCATDKGAEDVQMGKCMQNLGVKLKPTVDVLRRTRFHCFSPEGMINARFPAWFYKYDSEGGRGGMENISDYAISFHYVSPDKMYFLEFYTYHLHAYGIQHKPQQLNNH